MELFVVQFEGVDALPRHLVGMREFTDMPPLAQLRGADHAKAAAEAAADSIQRKRMHKANGRGGPSNARSTGTPRETDWQDFQEPGEASSSNASSPSVASDASKCPRLRPGFHPTDDRAMRTHLLETLSSWNVRCKPVTCCEFHCLMDHAQQLMTSMRRCPCSPIPCDLSWQCGGCGILNANMQCEDGCCALCGWGHDASDGEHNQVQSIGVVGL